MKALLVNRVGDTFLLIAIALIIYVFGSTDFSVVFYMTPFYSLVYLPVLGFKVYLYDTLALLLFLSAVSKSAQFGLHI